MNNGHMLSQNERIELMLKFHHYRVADQGS